VYNTSRKDLLTSSIHIRYRGYYYDTETSLYFVQGRYYDPEIGRFIEAILQNRRVRC